MGKKTKTQHNVCGDNIPPDNLSECDPHIIERIEANGRITITASENPNSGAWLRSDVYQRSPSVVAIMLKLDDLWYRSRYVAHKYGVQAIHFVMPYDLFVAYVMDAENRFMMTTNGSDVAIRYRGVIIISSPELKGEEIFCTYKL